MRHERLRVFTTFVTFLFIFGFAHAQTEPLEWAPCAVDCINQVTAPVASDCKMAFVAFAMTSLFSKTPRIAVSHNITSTTCQFPDRDIGPSGTAVTFVSMGVSLVFVGMQLMVFASTRAWGWDDILIAVGTVMMIGNAICNPIARGWGFGRDAWRIPFSHTDKILEIFYAGGLVYVTGVAVTKMAFLCFYIRLFPTPGLRRVAFPMLALTGIQGVIFLFLFAFQCSPVAYTWLQWDGEAEGSCLGFEVGAAIHAIVNIILDFAIFALPMFQLRTLNLSKKKRWQVLLMFAVGFLQVLPLAWPWRNTSLRNPHPLPRRSRLLHNLSRDYVALGYWSDLELNIGIACFCMPAARVILRRYFPNCGLGSTAATDEGYYVNTIGGGRRKAGASDFGQVGSNSDGTGPIHKKTISKGKVVDVVSSATTTGEWSYEVGEDGRVARLPKGHVSRHSEATTAVGTVGRGRGNSETRNFSRGGVAGAGGAVGSHMVNQYQHSSRSREPRGEDDTDSDVELVPLGLQSAIEGGAGVPGARMDNRAPSRGLSLGKDGRIERSMV
ncbi:uncharacterized protein AB675_3044 [Cyphellophora attinorum]|uniref:Rhodopsin domain-containing protein n=1 Tax=Cyphellophora attinorum TaxID=1664694 RepID=A0A0N0NKH1_9EURO|nr:uncharacterized protein AB675_3044 [Phialophora attinorum]KPI37839.1 hypothetical protein AB675_3044 [Phialophora attinorum]